MAKAKAKLTVVQGGRNKPRNLAHVTRDRGYRWSERDPILDEVCRLITNSGLSAAAVAARAEITAATVNAWLSGHTKRPQNATIDAVLRALGFRRRIEVG